MFYLLTYSKPWQQTSTCLNELPWKKRGSLRCGYFGHWQRHWRHHSRVICVGLYVVFFPRSLETKAWVSLCAMVWGCKTSSEAFSRQHISEICPKDIAIMIDGQVHNHEQVPSVVGLLPFTWLTELFWYTKTATPLGDYSSIDIYVFVRAIEPQSSTENAWESKFNK